MKDRVCTSCGHVGKPTKQCLESFLVDAFAWGLAGSFALGTGLMPVLAIPAAWTLYHLMKFNTTKCPSCGNLDMVSMDSRKGQKVLNQDKSRVRVWTSGEEAASAK
jgi:predicted RNA-binding Zn-ribbon protein involved in translation (DUF1610 family)